MCTWVILLDHVIWENFDDKAEVFEEFSITHDAVEADQATWASDKLFLLSILTKHARVIRKNLLAFAIFETDSVDSRALRACRDIANIVWNLESLSISMVSLSFENRGLRAIWHRELHGGEQARIWVRL